MSLNRQDRNWLEYVLKIQSGLNAPFNKQWLKYREIYNNKLPEDGPPLAWLPDENHLKESNLARFMADNHFNDYKSLHKWSVKNRADFWGKVIKELKIHFSTAPDKILDISKGASDPRWLPGARLNIADSCFKGDRNQPAVLYASEKNPKIKSISYAQLNILTNRVANGLLNNGFKSNDRIVIYMPMTVECVAAYLGVIKAGCQVVSIADSFSADELKRRIKIASANGIITMDKYVRGSKLLDLYKKVCDSEAPRAVIISSGKPALRSGDILWTEFLSDKTTFDTHACDPYTPINILFSSGTTGDPKAIPWTHLTPLKSAMDGYFHQDIRPGDVAAWPTNIGWMMGPWLIFASLINKATIALYEGSPAGKGFVDFVENAGVTMLGVVPSLVRAWRNANIPDMDSWKNIRAFSSTGEPSNREDYLWLMSRTRYRAPVIEYLGGTEIGGGHITGTVVQPASPATFTTPALGIDFVLLNSENKPVKEGESGELFLIPPSIGLSQSLLNRDHDEIYYKDCPSGPQDQVLRRHGDQMIKLHNGFYKAQGRADDTMNLGGIKVSSIELEQLIEQHPSVYESAAVSVQPEGEGQEKLVIYIVPAMEIPDQNKLKDELGKSIAKKLNPLFKIYDLKVTEKLPRTASNKLMRRVLRNAYFKG